ncbi:MAG: hypothetical protein ACUVWB_06460 [Anaerolineae bacterium]
MEARPAAQESAADPDDEDTCVALRLQLKKLLAKDEALARQVQQALRNGAM